MDAIVMAGGMGRRLGEEEKPLTPLCGRPMISYVLSALLGSENIDRVFVATSPKVRKTAAWLSDFKKEHDNIEILNTPGRGFVNDMVLSVEKAGIKGYVLFIMADLPLVTSGLIDRIIEGHENMKMPALSVNMRLDVCTRLGLRPDTVFHKNDMFIVPCGINILDAGMIREEQEEFVLILEDEELALNVNTQAELSLCRMMLENRKVLMFTLPVK